MNVLAFVANLHQRFELSVAKIDSFIESQKSQVMSEKKAADFPASDTGVKIHNTRRKRIPCFQGNDRNLMAVTDIPHCLTYSALKSRKGRTARILETTTPVCHQQKSAGTGIP